jgi:hypothetical protein
MHRSSLTALLALPLALAACGASAPDETVIADESAFTLLPPIVPPAITISYTFNNVATGKNLDAPDHNRPGAPDDPVNQFTPHSGWNQRWRLISAGTYTDPANRVQNTYRIRNMWTGLCLDFFEQGIKQQDCNAPARVNSTRFYFENGAIKTATGTPGTPYCIDVPNASPNDGVQVRRNGCNGSASEQWTMTRHIS